MIASSLLALGKHKKLCFRNYFIFVLAPLLYGKLKMNGFNRTKVNVRLLCGFAGNSPLYSIAMFLKVVIHAFLMYVKGIKQ